MEYDDYLRRHAEHYRQLAQKTEDFRVKEELLGLAAVCDDVADNMQDRLTAG
jgi:hypothetical protein